LGIDKMPAKQDALQRIESHEKLCRIMQKQTYDRMHELQSQITRIERILLVSMGAVMTGMGGVIVVLLQKL
tara:strand:+ start:928 stop:1140 length:213 start_codon:yes stop_codon:yes gene_type:complete